MESVSARLQRAVGDRYVIGEAVARGGMAVVYRAEDTKHARAVAIKVLHEHLAYSIGADRFLREIRLIAGLQHPHIVPLFDSGEGDSLLWYSMPYIEGVTLRGRMEREGAFSTEETQRIGRELCDALQYAHDRGVVHRDVKPENVLFADGHALLSDFGIARVLHLATKRTLTTESGMILGTPAYMSPEQATGDHALDGRSDVYSLGCVLYEMLTTVRPQRVATPAGGVGVANRPTLRRLREFRADAPLALEDAITRALALDRDDRFPTAAAFGEAMLSGADSGAGVRSAAPRSGSTVGSVPAAARPASRRARLAVIAVLVVVAALGAWRYIARGVRVGAVDPQLLVLLPLTHDGGPFDAWLHGEDCAYLLFDAFSRWRGLSLVDEMRMRDAVARVGGRIKSLDEATRVARRLGAGRLVWGFISAAGDVMELRATMYDVSVEPVQTLARVRRTIDEDNVLPSFESIADSLVLQTEPSSARDAPVGAHNLEAVREYVQAKRALDAWQLDSALAGYTRAARLDSSYAEAHLWAAQVASWLPRTEGSVVATHAFHALRGGLSERDVPRARALQAAAAGRYQAACSEYRSLLRVDSLDFGAWYGLGDCLSRDDAVLPDSTSPTRWRFRTSRHEAVAAYERALGLAPSFQNAFGSAAAGRLETLLLATPNQYVGGAAVAPDSTQFAAFPGWSGETLSVVPWPFDYLLDSTARMIPATYALALDQNRARVLRVAERWATALPSDVRALESHALALENVSRIDTVRGVASALSQLTRARAIADSLGSPVRAQLALHEVRVLVKLARWASARALADSLLGNTDSLSTENVRNLAPLALMLGRVSLGRALARRAWTLDTLVTSQVDVLVGAPVLEAYHAFVAHLAVGASADSIRHWRARTLAAIRTSLRADQAAVAGARLVADMAFLAYPSTGVLPEHDSPGNDAFLNVEAALARGEGRRTLATLRELEPEQQGLRTSDAGPEFVYLIAWLRREAGDTSTAVARSDAYLESLPATNRSLLQQMTAGAGLVRLMAVRAELAQHAGDRGTARRYAAAVITLWSGSDAFLQPVVSRMRVIRDS